MTKTSEKSVRRSVSHDEAMAQSLRQDPEFAAGYLEAAMREGSRAELLIALRHLAKAYGGIAKLAEATGLNENTLHRTLSARGNPRLDTFVSICGAMGMQIHITPAGEQSQIQ